jgi:coenzyme F420 hydrogenase subunit beta
MGLGARVRSISDVVERQLCTGCGACAWASGGGLRMVDALEHGRRPVAAGAGPDPEAAARALRVCPGAGLSHDERSFPPGILAALRPAWGPVLEVWEGFASDPELRHAASSGGVASALALFCLERAGMHGVLHDAPRPDAPYLNHTVLSRSRAELLLATGSRYAPASPCDGLGVVESAPAPCVLLAKPCDVAAAARARRLRPALDQNLGLTVAMFCAGTPSTRGTLELLRSLGVEDPRQVVALRYRGQGWPGLARVQVRTPEGVCERTLGYAESWGLLQRYRQWRCYVCADHTGEFGDVAVGDPWYRPIPEGEPGRSLVLVRSERGRRLLREAALAGALHLEPAPPEILAASQPELLRARGAIWARIWVSQLLGAAAPRYRGLPTFRTWWSELSPRQKLRSIFGTARRVFRRRLHRRVPIEPWRPAA